MSASSISSALGISVRLRDALTTSYTIANFNNANVGSGKPVSVTGIAIGGTDAGNYTFNTTATTTANRATVGSPNCT